jgi:hypothetical protein
MLESETMDFSVRIFPVWTANEWREKETWKNENYDIFVQVESCPIHVEFWELNYKILVIKAKRC